MILPSKELLSEVNQTCLVPLGKLTVEGSDLCLWDNREPISIYMAWNIHELAHKCKEWAYNNGYDLMTSNCTIVGKNSLGFYCYILNKDWLLGDLEDNSEHICRGFSEPEAIFIACWWILKEIKRATEDLAQWQPTKTGLMVP